MFLNHFTFCLVDKRGRGSNVCSGSSVPQDGDTIGQLRLHKEGGDHVNFDAVIFIGRFGDLITVNEKLMVVVHFDLVTANVDCNALCTGGLAVSTFYIVGNDIKVGIVDQVV